MALKNIPFYSSLLGKKMFNYEIGRHQVAQRNHVLVYGAIEAHDQGEKGCIASNRTIAQETGFTAQTVANAIAELKRSGWIIVSLDANNHRTSIKPMLALTLESNPPYSGGEPPLTLESNIEYSKENTVREKGGSEFSHTSTEPEKEKGSAQKEKELLDLLNSKTGRNFRVLPRGTTKLLKTFTLEEIDTALGNLTKDPWHKEKINELSSDYLLRSTTIDKFFTQTQIPRKVFA